MVKKGMSDVKISKTKRPPFKVKGKSPGKSKRPTSKRRIGVVPRTYRERKSGGSNPCFPGERTAGYSK